jgi:DNA-directed RNA polymerase subunit RPC12/RpoP
MRKQFVCKNCGFKGARKKLVKGSILTEIFLWFFFLLPGIIYSVWRANSKKYVCPKCGAQDMIPADSPMGQKLLTEKIE